jgi:predicted RNase H-like HicB family nuclease
VKTEQLLWSGQSQSEDVQSINKLIDEVIALVIKDLQKNKLLPAKS